MDIDQISKLASGDLLLARVAHAMNMNHFGLSPEFREWSREIVNAIDAELRRRGAR